MPFRPPKKPPQFADLKDILAQSKTSDNSLYQTIEQLIDRLTQSNSQITEQIASIVDKTENVINKINKELDKIQESIEEIEETIDIIDVINPSKVLGRGSLHGKGPPEELTPGIYIIIEDKIIEVAGAGDTSFIVQNLDDARSKIPSPHLPSDYLPRAQETKLLASGYVTVTTGTGVLGSAPKIPAADIEGSIPPGAHQATHQIGGIDELINAAWKHINNNFVAQTIGSGTLILGLNSVLAFQATDSPADSRKWRIVNYGDITGNLHITSLNDGETITLGDITFTRIGEVICAGLGTTPLNASQLTSGTVPDVRLSVNVLKHTGGYPGGTSGFLRADGTFATPPTGGGVPGLHASTHQPGGSDPLSNVAWTNLINTFTADQLIFKSIPQFKLGEIAGGPNQKFWSIASDGNSLNIQTQNDGGVFILRLINFERNGNVTIEGVLFVAGGLGATPLNASQLTSGTVPLARLPAHASRHAAGGADPVNITTLSGFPLNSALFLDGTGVFRTIPVGSIPLHGGAHVPGLDAIPNAAYRNIDNNFVPQSLGSGTTITGGNSLLYLYDTSAPVDKKRWRILNLNDGNLYFNLLTDSASAVLSSPITIQGDGWVQAPSIRTGRIRFDPPIPDDDTFTFDDYRERTWISSFSISGGVSGLVYGAQEGWAIKTGKKVTASFRVGISSLGTVGGGGVLIDGCPYINGPYTSIGSVLWQNLGAVVPSMCCYVNPYSHLIYLYYQNNNNMVQLIGTMLATGTYLYGTISFQANQ